MLENLILAQTVELINDPVIASDDRGRVVFSNMAHARISGWNPDELKGRNKRLLYEVPDLERAKKAGSRSVEAILYRKDGSKLSLNVKCSPLHLPELVDEEIGEIAIFHLPKFEDEDAPRSSDDFVSTVSHELRTPLTSIKGFAETLINSGDKVKAEDRTRFLKIIKQQADHLTRLVEDLLFVSRLDNQKIHLVVREIEIKKYIDKVCEALSTQAASRVFLYSFPPGLPRAMADSDRLEQILSNLISNAIKYSPDNTQITLSAGLSEDKKMIKVSITDQGVGITADNHEVIFNRFSRLDNPLTRETKGTGLGLYITKSLVHSMNGEIFLENTNPKETTFSFTLPVSQSSFKPIS
jgi:two-component system, OmpR family, phosphate regulon sensor histidine kinase PhoR